MYVYTYVFIQMHIYERHCVRWSSCCCGIFHNYCAALRSVTLRIDAHLRIHSAFLSDMVACVGCLHKHPFNHQMKTLISTMYRIEYPQRCKYATCAVRVRVRERRQRELISQRSAGSHRPPQSPLGCMDLRYILSRSACCRGEKARRYESIGAG